MVPVVEMTIKLAWFLIFFSGTKLSPTWFVSGLPLTLFSTAIPLDIEKLYNCGELGSEANRFTLASFQASIYALASTSSFFLNLGTGLPAASL